VRTSHHGPTTAVIAGQLIDGTGGPPVSDAVIVIDGERITAVGRRGDVTVSPEAEVIDAGDCTVMPGLIDVHVHVHTPGGPITNYALAEGRELQGTLALRALAYVWRGLEMGFTTLRSLGSPAYIDVALRDAISDGHVTGPRLLVAGQGLSVTGGHMDKPLWSPEVAISGRTGVCDGADSCRQAARVQFKRGVDLIKLNACSEALFHLDPPWGQEMTYEEMAAVCEVAHWLHRRVAAHTSGGPGITAAIRAGVDSLEHAHWLSDEQIQMMVEQGTFYVPTLAVNSRSVELGPDTIAVSQAEWKWLLKVDEDKWETLRRAKAAGVKIVAGSDAGFVVAHGESARELEELVKGGFTPHEAIGAATRVAAECLGLERDIGTIEPGKFADVVVVAGDPLADVRILQDKEKIAQVLIGGQTVARRAA
jgi:imidazolonepropionase-like amidohydrolase